MLVRAHAEQKRLVRERAAAKTGSISQRDHEASALQLDQGRDRSTLIARAARAAARARERRTDADRREQGRSRRSGRVRRQRGDAGRHQRRAAVAVHRRRRDRDALPRHAVRLGRRRARRGFDCSGFVAYVYAQVGVSLPHYTGAQWNVGVPVSRCDLEPGDLVFFDGLGHVGIYIGGGQFIHAPHTGDVVKISSLDDAWYAATYDGARRITG